MDRDTILKSIQNEMEQYSQQRPQCPWNPETCTTMRKHGTVLRNVIIVIEEEASVIWIRLERWSCGCGRTFRHYPPEVLRYKRYTRHEILTRVKSMVPPKGKSCLAVAAVDYAQADAQTPTRTDADVAKKTSPLSIADGSSRSREAEPSAREVKMMAPSTPWRWVRYLSSILGDARLQWQSWLNTQAEFRPEAWVIPPCRSQARRDVWIRCVAALRALSSLIEKYTTDFAMTAPGP